MKNKQKIIIASIALAIIMGTGLLIGKTSFLQGKLSPIDKNLKIEKIDYSKLFMYKNKIVSGVTSPVTSSVSSIVVSKVTSELGTSKVASVVTSAVTSPVTSAVTVDKKLAANVDTTKLKSLTEKTLIEIGKNHYKNNKDIYAKKAKEDFAKYPERFKLNKEQKQLMINLYKKDNPKEFIFEPRKK